MARANDPGWKGRAQNGGTVSALVDLAIREGMIQAAVLTRRNAYLLPQGFIAREKKEILECAGSSYISGPTLEAFNRGPWQDGDRIGIVGLPCQILAAARMRVSPMEQRTPIHRIGITIGLFCTWALSYQPFVFFLGDRFPERSISRLDISPPPERLLHVVAGGEPFRFSLEEIRPFIRAGCRVCFDMTSEFSDLSVGSVEGKEGWNTVVLRTARGEELAALAESKGLIETRPLDRERLGHLKEASFLKKQRALKALRDQREMGESYLTLGSQWTERYLPEGDV